MTKMHGTFLGGKRVELLHDDSGATLVTDAPKDNQGDGSGFSPTDMIAAGLGSCILTTMAIAAERDGISLGGSYFTVEKQMSSNPRRISKIPVSMHLPSRLTPEQRDRLEKFGRGCPVHRSLHPETEAPIEFLYDVTT